ncbi:MAG TPA: hypothetical protein VJP02_17850 [Candidatus Sulfotelmatobacter sp.]|nr:hypothetical protein [Candidatus Sulfotelmatobacter sp.]
MSTTITEQDNMLVEETQRLTRRLMQHGTEKAVKHTEEMLGTLQKFLVSRGRFTSVVPADCRPGETSRYFNDIEDAMPFYDALRVDEEASLVLAPDGRWCMTVTTLTADELNAEENSNAGVHVE